jgi:hypothetical protein
MWCKRAMTLTVSDGRPTRCSAGGGMYVAQRCQCACIMFVPAGVAD